jgi:hypothetical protein
MDFLQRILGNLSSKDIASALFASTISVLLLLILSNQVLYQPSKCSAFPTINGTHWLEFSNRRILADFVMDAQRLMRNGLEVSWNSLLCLISFQYHRRP